MSDRSLGEVVKLKVALSLMNEAAILLGYCRGCGEYEVGLRRLILDTLEAQRDDLVVEYTNGRFVVVHRNNETR